MSQSLLFFASESDLRPRIAEIESVIALDYYWTTEAQPSPDFASRESIGQFEGLGRSRTGNRMTDGFFLVVEAGTRIKTRRTRLRRGGTNFGLYQGDNPSSLVFSPGGIYEDKCLVASEIATASNDPTSIQLFRIFRRELTRGFHRIRDFPVGPGALGLLQSGLRLVPLGAKEPAEMDLMPDPPR
jgi:hypothetical protein